MWQIMTKIIPFFFCGNHYFKQLGHWPISKKKKKKKKEKKKERKEVGGLLAVPSGWKIVSIAGKSLERLKTFDAFDQSRTILGTP